MWVPWLAVRGDPLRFVEPEASAVLYFAAGLQFRPTYPQQTNTDKTTEKR